MKERLARVMASNMLCKILNMYPDVWKQPKRFHALAMDLMPQDKLTRNLLSISISENIPFILCEKKIIQKFDIAVLTQKMIDACGCNYKIADAIIHMWIEALQVNVDDIPNIEIENVTIEEMNLSVRASNCLRRNSVKKISDILAYTPDEFLKIKNLGLRAAREIIENIDKRGLPYEMLEGCSSVNK